MTISRGVHVVVLALLLTFVCRPPKFTDLECTLASILSRAADFITVGYGAYDLGNDHTRQIL